VSLATRIVGDNAVHLWGLSMSERTRRLALAQGHRWLDGPAEEGGIVVNAAHAFDPAWYRHIAANPGAMLTQGGVPVLAHTRDAAEAALVEAAMLADQAPPAGHALTGISIEQGPTVENKELRKRVTPFVDRLTQANVPALERASYFGAYKGVTDLLTKYLWPEWALVLTRIAARLRITPNQVTALGFVLCVWATWLFWTGHYWAGMAAGLGFMVLDTVDGKLARCTITSSQWGHAFDHGIDLVHPLFWWWAWAEGLEHWGLALSERAWWLVLAAIVAGYVVQRLIEGAFIVRHSQMHIHVWQRLDSQFRLITARRNPNMVILFAATAAGRPDLGLIAVAWWTVLSCLFHAVRLVQAEWAAARSGTPLRSWLEDAA
jgi:phosphatidylglycerophosphate synthase